MKCFICHQLSDTSQTCEFNRKSEFADDDTSKKNNVDDEETNLITQATKRPLSDISPSTSGVTETTETHDQIINDDNRNNDTKFPTKKKKSNSKAKKLKTDLGKEPVPIIELLKSMVENSQSHSQEYPISLSNFRVQWIW